MSDETNALALPDDNNEPSWKSIVDPIIANVIEKHDPPDQVIRALELLLAGHPTNDVAKELHVQTSTVRRWLMEYPQITAALYEGEKALSAWRTAKIDQLFVDAIDVTKQILSLDLSGQFFDEDGGERHANPKILPVIAAQARYIIGLRAGQKKDISVEIHATSDSATFKAKSDALDYLAQSMNTPDVIDGEFIIRDTKGDNKALIKDDGTPLFGNLGTIMITEDGCLCHICGVSVRQLEKHVNGKHKLTNDDYELLFALKPTALRQSYKLTASEYYEWEHNGEASSTS